MKVSFTHEVEIPESWISFCLGEVFERRYCGYWLFGFEYDAILGWLTYESDSRPTDDDAAPALRQFQTGKVDLAHWQILNRDVAIKAYIEGVKRFGEAWYEKAYASDYDVVIQLALLGEVKYA